MPAANTDAARPPPTGEVLRHCAITAAPLDVGALLAAVADPGAGGQAVFVGTVRDHDEGQPVRALHYDAHPGAVDILRQVAGQVAQMPGLVAIAVEHRTGDLAVGDLAVVVAVAAWHRQEAFAGCRALIDDLKAQVPIWKLQHYADGSSAWVGCP